MSIILKRKLVKKNGDEAVTSFPVTEQTVSGVHRYFYQPHGFWICAEDIGRKFNQFDGSTISWSLEK